LALAQWIEGRGGIEPDETTRAIATVRRFIEAHGEARFDNLDDTDLKPAQNRAGWRSGTGEERRWLIPPETWKGEVCAGLDPKFVATMLARRGMLAKGSDGNMRVERIAGTTKRVYVITPAIFDGGET
jgi:putative DNA primase/helicase